jgi:hypothetical protein
MPKSKKTTKKRAAKKATPRREHPTTKYELAGDLSDKIKSQQQLLIKDAMQKLGPATAAEIADQIKDKLKTKQEPQRVVTFYLTAWKKVGVVKAVA